VEPETVEKTQVKLTVIFIADWLTDLPKVKIPSFRRDQLSLPKEPEESDRFVWSEVKKDAS